VQRYAPEIEARLRWIWRASSLRRNWRVDETYVRVRRGRWAYLYRAVDEEGRTLDFHLSPTRSAEAAKRFLGKAIRACEAWETPVTLTTDKAPTYPIAIAELKREGRCPPHVVHRRAKYLNNRIEADHGQLKRLIRPTLGFKSMRTAYATIKGFEVMRALEKGQGGSHQIRDGIRGEVRLVERAFGIGPDALSEMFDRLQTLDLAA
jgi:transposase-like protein